MWKNEKDNDREKRRVRGRKRREREIERRKKSARKREENKTPHASRGITSCIYAGGFFAALIAMIVISVATGGKALPHTAKLNELFSCLYIPAFQHSF